MFLGRRHSLPQATVKMAVGQGITTSKHFADCDAGQYSCPHGARSTYAQPAFLINSRRPLRDIDSYSVALDSGGACLVSAEFRWRPARNV